MLTNAMIIFYKFQNVNFTLLNSVLPDTQYFPFFNIYVRQISRLTLQGILLNLQIQMAQPFEED